MHVEGENYASKVPGREQHTVESATTYARSSGLSIILQELLGVALYDNAAEPLQCIAREANARASSKFEATLLDSV